MISNIVEWNKTLKVTYTFVFRAFGWSPPAIGHLPLILNKDGSKLSKRQGDIHIEHYRAKGYSAEAVLNFVTDIGGGFEGRDSRLLLSVDELIKKVSEVCYFLHMGALKRGNLVERVVYLLHSHLQITLAVKTHKVLFSSGFPASPKTLVDWIWKSCFSTTK